MAPSAATLKPGQKYQTPTPGFGDRVFYESLLRQRPDSEMAQDWYVYLQYVCSSVLLFVSFVL